MLKVRFLATRKFLETMEMKLFSLPKLISKLFARCSVILRRFGQEMKQEIEEFLVLFLLVKFGQQEQERESVVC